MKIHELLAEAKRLSPVEQLDLIRSISESLQIRFRHDLNQIQDENQDAIPDSVARTQPVTDLGQLAADFWPDDESIDELNAYVRQARAADRLNDR